MTPRNPYNYSTEAVSFETGLDCPPWQDRTRQEFSKECDINTIAKRFGLTGQLPEKYDLPQYGDYEGVVDFHSAMNAVRQAEADFATLPAKVREYFANDPQQLLEFVEDARNRDKAVELGLIKPTTPLAAAPAVASPPPDSSQTP